jgi:hypothetical protein
LLTGSIAKKEQNKTLMPSVLRGKSLRKTRRVFPIQQAEKTWRQRKVYTKSTAES